MSGPRRLAWPRGGTVLCIAITLSAIAAEGWADSPGSTFLIVERPQHLRLYDRYQQSLPDPGKAGIEPFLPLKVLHEHDLLGDGLTPCMRVEAHGSEFFLGLQGESELIGSAQLGFRGTFPQATELQDTVEVRVAGRILLLSPQRSARRLLAQGARAARLFQTDTLVFVRMLLPTQEFGWLRLPEQTSGSDWSILEQAPRAATGPLADIVPRLRPILAGTNAALTSLFTHLNSTTGKRRGIPQWEIITTDSSMLVELHDGGESAAFAESSQLLAKRLESVLLGTQLRIIAQPGRIEIR